ncbi:MAG: DUF1489 domain-containing protein [Alphaproteobacteria bacterium]
MTVHIVKMAVGIDDLAHLRRVQKRRLAEASGTARGRRGARVVVMRTRGTPRRAGEILDGGSIYWVIRGAIRARQRVLAIVRRTDAQERRYCVLSLDPNLVETSAMPTRAFQGWRYLDPAAAPPDRKRTPGDVIGMPPEMVAELRALGLL